MNDKPSSRILLSSILCLSFAGCGGGGGSSAPAPTAGGDGGSGEVVSSSGKVIDGYISGATVFMDLNFNGELDEGEPSAISGDRGDYTLELGESEHQCLGYVPIVVNVPVGAIDEDQGEVTEAFQMVLPPSMETPAADGLHNISPLTSAIWETIESEWSKTEPEARSCDSILASAAEREELKAVLEQAIADVVKHYNVAETALFSDFVANNDTETQAKAIEIVRGLKKSFADTAQLKRDNPDALFARVNYHKFSSIDGGELYPNAWYRETNLFYDGGSTIRLEKVSDDLGTVIRTILYGERNETQSGDLAFYESFEHESRGGDDSPYSCDTKEGISTAASGKSYELTNLISKSASTFEDCQAVQFATDAYGRYAFVSYAEGDVKYGAQFHFTKDPLNGFYFLVDWLDLKGQLQTLDSAALISALESLPYGFTDVGDGGSTWWVKKKDYAEGGRQITLSVDNEGRYRRITTLQDGTHTTECSIDGETWIECS